MRRGINFDLTVPQTDPLFEDEVIALPECYTRHLHIVERSRRFCIPKEITDSLNLQAGQYAYFVCINGECAVHFNKRPKELQKDFYKTRKIGKYSTSLYVALPYFIRRNYPDSCKIIQLIKTRDPNIWQIQGIIQQEFTSQEMYEDISD